MTNSEYCFDAWAVRQIATNDFGSDHWDSNDEINYMDNTVDPTPDDDDDKGEIINDEDDIDIGPRDGGDPWGYFDNKDSYNDTYNPTDDYGYNNYNNNNNYDGSFFLTTDVIFSS